MRLIDNSFVLPRRPAPTAFCHALAGLVLSLVTVSASAQSAQNRILPADSYQVTIDAISPPSITIDNTTVQIAAGSLIFTGENRTITSSNLAAGTVVRVEFNGMCQIKKIWILNAEEVIPKPWWMALIPSSFTPPC